MRTTTRNIIAIAACLGACTSPVSAFTSRLSPPRTVRTPLTQNDGVRKNTQLHSIPDSSREMRQTGFNNDGASPKRRKRDKSSVLSAVAIDSLLEPNKFELESILATIQPVLSAALLVTGNTVGAGSLVLPELAAGPGMAVSTLVFMGAYVMNLISGLVIAEVAIKQHESSGSDVPSSFKEFADANLDSPMAGNLISGISIFVNACVMSFDLVRAGEITSGLTGGIEAGVMTLGVAALLTSLVGTQSSQKLSGIASMAVTALFVSFSGLLIPGLMNVHDPVGAFFGPGTSSDIMTGVSHAAPIILMTMVYQNIVPSVAKILNYDRTKTTVSIVLGSIIPMFMYLAWCLAVIGGGIDLSVGAGGPLLTAFSLAAVSGSSIGASMSLSEELDCFFKTETKETSESAQDRVFSLPAVLLSVAMPLAAGYMFAGGEGGTVALRMAGSYGSPLLYGAIPVAMAWTQRTKQKGRDDMLPGGFAFLGSIGAAAVGFMGQELVQDIGSIIATAS